MAVAAQAAEGLGQLDDATRLYRQLVSLGQEVGPSRRSLARLALRRKDVDGALRELAPSLKGNANDLADVTLAVELLRAANRAEEAAAWARRQQQLQTEQMAQQYLDKGMGAANSGNLSGAITWFEAALSVHESPQVRVALGRVYFDLGRYADAEAQQRRAIAIAPTFGQGWFGLAETLAARGDRPGAAAAFRRYMEIEPSGFFSAKAKQAVDRLERR
jgi:tetratricopeptide (TPR) repeat protein